MIDFLDRVLNFALWFSIPMAVTYVLLRIIEKAILASKK